MTTLRFGLLVTALSLAYTASAQSPSPPFAHKSNTGNNATLVLPVDAAPVVGDEPLRQGDQIGVYSWSGMCVGSIVWQEENQAITIWGNDVATDDTDGLEEGERFLFKVWRAGEDELFRYVHVSLEDKSPEYRTNGIYVITEFRAAGTLPSPAPKPPGEDEERADTRVTLTWSSPFPVQAYDVELATDDGFSENLRFFDGLEESSITIEDLEPSTTYFWRVRAHDDLGAGEWSPPASFETAVGLNSGDDTALPRTLQLHQNYPNPFNPATVIPFDVDRPQHVQLAIYDVTGRLLETLVNAFTEPGTHRVEWDAAGRASGSYFIILTADERVLSRKTLLLK